VELKSFEDEKHVLKIPYLKVKTASYSADCRHKKSHFISRTFGWARISGEIGSSDTKAVIDLDLDDLVLDQATILAKFIPVNTSWAFERKCRFTARLNRSSEQPREDSPKN
jgi:hypothetical protein